MPTKVVQFLKDLANHESFDVFDSLHGTIFIGQTPAIHQSCGSVYGIWARSSTPLSPELEAIPGHGDWYPVYWGKDISPVSRMKAHVQGHENGNIDLPNVAEVMGKELIFGAILVARYNSFESLLHDRFPPFKGSSKEGSRAKVVRIEN